MSKDIDDFSKIRPQYEKFQFKLKGLIEEIINYNKIDFLSIEGRTKSLESFSEKINRKGKNYSQPLTDITDICGIRIITYYTEDISKIAELIEKEFDVDYGKSIDKTKINKPDQFGYQSLHYVLKTSLNRNALMEWEAYKDMQAEIQIRTILQHSWSVIDHKLRYKSKGEIPSVLQRKIFRLSALLELADEEFLSIKKETIDFSNAVEKSIDKGNLDLQFNFISLESYISTNIKVKEIVNQSEKIGYQQYEVEDELASNHFLNRIMDVLNNSSLKNIQDLDDFLESCKLSFTEDLKKFLKQFNLINDGETFYAVAGDLITILIILNGKIVSSQEELYNSLQWGAFSRTISNLLEFPTSTEKL